MLAQPMCPQMLGVIGVVPVHTDLSFSHSTLVAFLT